MDTSEQPTILFNYLPPGLVNMPSPAFSVLKSYLHDNGTTSKIFYWNLQFVDLQLEFLRTSDICKLESEELNLLIFFNYISVRTGDTKSQMHIKSKLMQLKPHYIGLEHNFFEKHMVNYANKLDELIESVITKVCSEKISFYGFSANLYQWLPASIIAAKIREKYPNAVYLLGGIGSYETAAKFLEYFPQFDCALWGEGENTLTSVIGAFSASNVDLSSIPNIVYRTSSGIQKSNNNKVSFVDLSTSSIPDYSDYFSQIDNKWFKETINKVIPIEGGRGCHWNKCHFCYLNSGYKNRIKSVDTLSREIVSHISRYKCDTISFLDNDIINNDTTRFEQLLELLSKLKHANSNFKISLAEIITKGISSNIIKQMAIAGFESVQIGYESPSDTLLFKIQKKNTFASNLLFIKFALAYGIKVIGANIIIGLIEEDDADILEASENLYYLRFFLTQSQFQHSQSFLAVSSRSRYALNKKVRFNGWERSFLFSHYLSEHYCKKDPFFEIIDAQPSSSNHLWKDFFLLRDISLKIKYRINYYHLANK